MTKQKTYNEAVGGDAGFEDREVNPSCEGNPCANVAEDDAPETDTMADEEPSSDNQPATPTPEEVAAEWKDKYIRLQAEFDNYRKRTLREKMELVETGGQEVLKAVLPVVDDIERAVQANAKCEDREIICKGMELIAQKFADTLRQRKVVPIEAKGLPFNEELMEAVAKFPAGEEQKGLVIDVVQTGYMLGERVLRFAKVVVGE